MPQAARSLSFLYKAKLFLDLCPDFLYNSERWSVTLR